MSHEPQVSIIIPTKNSERTIESVLAKVYQQTTRDVEVIVIDSGSVDGSIRELSKFPVTLHRITPSEFGHGKTRGLGAQIAHARILVFLNADVVPKDVIWLEKLIRPLADGIADATFSRVLPRPEINPAEKYFILRTFPTESHEISLRNIESSFVGGFVVFSTYSGAIRRDVLNECGFKEDILIGEDNELGIRLLRRGYRIRYCADSIVIHGHDFSKKDVFARFFDYGLTFSQLEELRVAQSARTVLEATFYMLDVVAGTFRYAVSCCGLRVGVESIFYAIAKFVGYATGIAASSLPKRIPKLISYTERLKRS